MAHEKVYTPCGLHRGDNQSRMIQTMNYILIRRVQRPTCTVINSFSEIQYEEHNNFYKLPAILLQNLLYRSLCRSLSIIVPYSKSFLFYRLYFFFLFFWGTIFSQIMYTAMFTGHPVCRTWFDGTRVMRVASVEARELQTSSRDLYYFETAELAPVDNRTLACLLLLFPLVDLAIFNPLWTRRRVGVPWYCYVNIRQWFARVSRSLERMSSDTSRSFPRGFRHATVRKIVKFSTS